MKTIGKVSLLTSILFVASFRATGQVYTLSNSAYWAEYNQSTRNIRLVNKDYTSDTVTFTATFHVLVNTNPANPARVKISENIDYHTTAWSGNTNLYSAGESRIRSVQSVTQDGSKLLFSYTENTEFALSAEFELPSGDELPKLSYCLDAKKTAGFSVGYVGAPKYDATQLDELWQPLVWTEKKFPQNAYLTSSYHATLPSTMTTFNSNTVGVIADPEVYPFEPFPTSPRSEFGVALRNHEDLAQPMVWAPIMGRDVSEMDNGDSYCFTLRLFSGGLSIQDFYEELSLGLYGFDQYNRNNAVGSLNKTLDRMIDYGMSTYSRFNESAKGPSYETDIPGAVKVTSSLNPLNIAYVADDEEVFRQRCLPMMEFLLSRTHTTYADEETTGTGQTAYNTLGDPAMNFSELTALYDIFKGNMPFLLEMAEDKSINFADQAYERQWRQYIAMYRATSDEQYKNQAISAADQYITDRIDNFQTDFSYSHHTVSSFWVQLAPKFVDLMELYEITGDQKYLNAAREGARRFAMFTWMSPKVPDENITVNIGGQAPVYPHAGGSPISVPEESVAAWRLSNFGMHPEAAATAISHRSVFMAHHAPYFLKIGELTDDDYLIKIAKSAVIGRYRNFPGYHTNTDRTTVYEKADFPLRSHEEISSTSMHYNHVWPMMSLVLDYLVSDAISRSGEAIYFPSQFVEAFANLQSKIYGHKPGSFYHVDSATLWMPKGLLDIDNEELNYIAARKGDSLLLAFTNQSSSMVTANVEIDTALVGGLTGSHAIEVITNNGGPVSLTMNGDDFSVSVAADGITAVIIKGVEIDPAFQDKLYAEKDTTWTTDYLEDDFASTKAMFLNFGEELSEVFIFSTDEKGTYTNVTIKYVVDGDTITVSDSDYPYEFEIDLPAGAESFSFIMETTDESGNHATSEVMTLSQPIIVKGTMVGDYHIPVGESAELQIQLEGVSPWSIVYSDGVTSDTINDITMSSYVLPVSPTASKVYSLLAVADSLRSGQAFGESAVFVTEQSMFPVFDGMVREQQGDGMFNLDYAQIKEPGGYGREAIFTFDISGLDSLMELAAFRLYVYSANKEFSASLKLDGIDQGFNNNLTWGNKPADNAYTPIGDLNYKHTRVPAYISWDITEYLNQSIADSAQRFTARVTVEGSDVLLSVRTIEKTGLEPQLLYTFSEEDNQRVTGYEDRMEEALYVYPNPTDQEVAILSSGSISQLILLDMQGHAVRMEKPAVRSYKLNIAGLPSGVYFLKVHVKDKVTTHKLVVR